MAFTEKERRAWHQARRTGRDDSDSPSVGMPTATCLHCQRSFLPHEGVITEEAALCDICNGD